ncbi:MAG: YihY family inner membrane protein [Azonexus sp.]
MQTHSRYRRSPPKPGVPATIFRRFRTENMMQTSSALAFTTLMALVPLVTLILSVAEVVPYLNLLLTRLELLIQGSLLPTGTASTISGGIARFSHRAQQLTVAGIAFLSITVFILMHTIERAFNHLWQVKPRPFLTRLKLYLFAMLVWPFVLAAVAAAISFAVTTSLGFIEETEWIRRVTFKAMSVLVFGLFFSFLYYAVPNAPVSRRGALAGGLFATLAFALMQKLFEWYLASSAILKSVYGAFAAFPVFLIWLHLSWAVVLFGGLIAATTSRPARR